MKFWGCIKDKPNAMKLIRNSTQISLNIEKLNTDDTDEAYSLKSTVQPIVKNTADKFWNFEVMSRLIKILWKLLQIQRL